MKQSIIWVASYPKSGNTMIRAFLSAYFFTKDGILSDFKPLQNITSFNNFSNYTNITSFPELDYFKKNPEEISKYWLINQEIINKNLKSDVIFYKTHNALIEKNSNYFTNNKQTKCFIYIVRDPRSVVISSKEHYGFRNYDEAIDVIISDKWISYVTKKPNLLPEFILSWKTNFLSWQNYYARNRNKGIILRYEDLVNNTEKTLYLLVEFLTKHLDFSINVEKFNNSIKSVSFKKLKNMEQEKGFNEKSKKTKNFFRKGKTDEWNNLLTTDQISKIIKNFKKEMTYLNYI